MLRDMLDDMFAPLTRALEAHETALTVQEIGILTHVGQGIARVSGLPGVQAEELW